MRSRDPVSALLAEIHAAPASQIESELSALWLSVWIFEENAVRLLDALHRFEGAIPNPLFRPGARAELWDFSFQVMRLLQNTVASGQSFLEHCTRTVRRRYRNTHVASEFERQYQSDIEQSPVCMFAKKLRNHVLHLQSVQPTITRRVVGFFASDGPMCEISISMAGLAAERDGWNDPAAISYLERIGDSLRISSFVTEYRVDLKRFADWFLCRQRALHTDSLLELDTLYQRLRHEAEIDSAGDVALIVEELEVFRRGAKAESWFR